MWTTGMATMPFPEQCEQRKKCLSLEALTRGLVGMEGARHNGSAGAIRCPLLRTLETSSMFLVNWLRWQRIESTTTFVLQKPSLLDGTSLNLDFPDIDWLNLLKTHWLDLYSIFIISGVSQPSQQPTMASNGLKLTIPNYRRIIRPPRFAKRLDRQRRPNTTPSASGGQTSCSSTSIYHLRRYDVPSSELNTGAVVRLLRSTKTEDPVLRCSNMVTIHSGWVYL